jgi:Na+/phosphate symporter
MQPPPAAEITPPPQETPVPEDSPAIKEKNAEIDKLVSQMGSSEMTKDEEKKLDEVFKQIEKLGEIREAESVNDVNAKDVNK